MSEKAEKVFYKRGYESKEAFPESTKRHFPKRLIASLGKIGGTVFGKLSPALRYILVGVLIATAAFTSWFLSVHRSPPDLLAPVLSLSWWISPLERGAVLRLPIINTDNQPERFAIVDESLYLSFQEAPTDATGVVSIDPEGNVNSVPAGADGQRLPVGQLPREAATIYFDSDSSALTPEAQDQVRMIADYLRRFPGIEIVIEGHAGALDKNSREYALALGERMAEAVREFLIKLGISANRVRTVSYGKERPVDLKDDAQNRRVEVITIEGVGQQASEASFQWKAIALGDDAIDTAAGMIPLGERWALSTDKGIVLARQNSARWLPVAVTKVYAENYLAQREPAFEFAFDGDQLRWRYKGHQIPAEAQNTLGSEAQATSGSSTQWSTDNFHKTYPAPLAYVILGGLGLMALLVISVKAAPMAVGPNQIVEHFASDAPITSAGSDCLGFDRIAKSISQFLRNEKTMPPLTIAITGQWGSGKSSLMQLLVSDLKAHRIQPIWLNAWHHQNEAQFLYGLLNAISAHGIPSLFSGAYLLFRIRLLASRVRQKPYYALLLAALLAIPIGFLSSVDKGILPENWVSVWFAKGNLAVLGTALPFILGLLNLSKEKLTNLASGKLRKHFFSLTASEIDLRSAAGVREKFVAEFRHFCNALGVSTLTVFIDDLDRCSERRVMDVLETVNFLVSSGKCIVVFGMDRGPVERAVANYYQESYQDADHDELIHFARRYLEKLVNIEVPVPTTQDKDTTRLVAARPPKKISIRKLMTLALSVLLLIGFSWVSLYLGTKFGKIVSMKEIPSQQSVAPSEESPSVERAMLEGGSDRQVPKNVEIIGKHEARKADNLYTLLPAIILIVLTGLIAIENYQQRRRILVYDSDGFTNAIHGWMRLMGSYNATPRTIKRFVNRARFLTMRLRNEPESGIGENDLVTLAGLHELNHELLDLIENGETDKVSGKIEKFFPDNPQTLNGLMAQSREFKQRNIIGVFKSWVQGFDIR